MHSGALSAIIARPGKEFNMSRIEIMEKLNAQIDSMDDQELEHLANLATALRVYSSEERRNALSERIAENERAMVEQERTAREQRRANLSRGEKMISNRIQRGRALAREAAGNQDLSCSEIDYLRDISQGGAYLAGDAFYLGFAKGYRVGERA